MTSLPNELLQNIIDLTDQSDLLPWLFVSKYTFQLVRQRVYKKVIFPDSHVSTEAILTFCELYGLSLETIKLPRHHYVPDTVYHQILQWCPRLDYLQSNLYPKQLHGCLQRMRHSTCIMSTDIPDDALDEVTAFHSKNQTITYFACCPSFFVFPSELVPEKNPTLTQISHYFHHPGALSNAILPTFGSDLLSLTLNAYDVLTSSVARLIVTKCPRLRYLAVPCVKAEGLWMLLRWCHTLVAIVVGHDDSLIPFEEEEEEEEEEDHLSRSMLTDIENERAVETVRQHKRVWCVHSNVHEDDNQKRMSWHIGIIPKI